MDDVVGGKSLLCGPLILIDSRNATLWFEINV